MSLHKKNLFQRIPKREPEECFEELLRGGPFRLERIVSQGHASPEGFWYDQDQAEWVLLLRGSATLEIEGSETPVELEPGDAVLIPAHTRHRVARTDAQEATVWLALFYAPRE